MKILKAINPSGIGLPRRNGDLRWMTDGVKEALKMVVGAISNNFAVGPHSYRIIGCAVTLAGGGTYNVAAGWVVIDGQPCYFAGGTGYANANNLYWDFDETFDPSGDKAYNGGTVNEYAVINAKIVVSLTAIAGRAVNGITFRQAVRNTILSNNESWYGLNDAHYLRGTWEMPSSSVYNSVYRKTFDNYLEAFFMVRRVAFSVGTLVLEIDDIYFPLNIMRDFYFEGIDTVTNSPIKFKITTSGQVIMLTTIVGNTNYIVGSFKIPLDL